MRIDDIRVATFQSGRAQCGVIRWVGGIGRIGRGYLQSRSVQQSHLHVSHTLGGR